MRVRVRLFAALREAAGRGELAVDVPAGATAEDAWRALVREAPALAPRRASLMASVNRRYASFDAPLCEDDEVGFIPPVSGG
jgi:molybdopterin converting factor subunit 1